MHISEKILCKGIFQKGNALSCAEGYVIGIEPKANKYIFQFNTPNMTVFIPEKNMEIKDEQSKQVINENRNSAVCCDVVLADEIKWYSGCKDQNGCKIYDEDIIEVNDVQYVVYFSAERMRWEVIASPPYADKPSPLYRLKESIALKATLVKTT